MPRNSTLVLIALSLLALPLATAARASTSGQQNPVASIELLVANGGRVDWYTGEAHELIAYDAVSNPLTRDTDVYTIAPDGSGPRCVTCDAAIPRGFIGQPAWHPAGEHLVIQAENDNSEHGLFNHLAWGINNDLWVVSRDGAVAQKIWESPLNHAALHAHFNQTGTQLVFSERIATGVTIPAAEGITPGGENQWAGWQIHLADFDLASLRLSNHQAIKPNGDGFYETHGFTDDGRLLYSFTPDGRPYVDDCFIADAAGRNVQNLTNSPATWEEHAAFSPSGEHLAFISSRFDPTWRAPQARANTLRTELYLQNEAGEISQLTDFNATGEPGVRYLTSDYDWDASGRRIAVQVAPVAGRPRQAAAPQIWLITFDGPQ